MAVKVLALLFLLALAFGLRLTHEGENGGHPGDLPDAASVYAQLLAAEKQEEQAQGRVD